MSGYRTEETAELELECRTSGIDPWISGTRENTAVLAYLIGCGEIVT
jgi:hypothetical protein